MQDDAEFHSAVTALKSSYERRSYQLRRIRDRFTQRAKPQSIDFLRGPQGPALVLGVEGINTLDIAFQGTDIVDLL
jgi:hypothetical protein